MKKLIISPQAGFGNRIRSLCSAAVLGSILDREVFHYWIRDPVRSDLGHVNDMKCIDPSYIFDLKIPIFDGKEVDICFTEWTIGDYWYGQQSTAQSSLLIKKSERIIDIEQISQCHDDIILIETSHSLEMPSLHHFWNAMMHSIYKSHFPLNARWQQIMDNLPKYNYGISVRRGDFLIHNRDCDFSCQDIAFEVSKLRGSKIIFSDDLGYQNSLRELTNCPMSLDLIAGQVDNSDVYIAQFLLLSNSDVVVGTRGSSFTEQAATFGGKAFLPIQALLSGRLGEAHP
jgi:hypothetical protein